MQTSDSVRPKTRSLADVHASVGTSQVSFWRRLFAFAGPAYLVSVGYMDPGNWATDIEGGARFGYRLLWVLVMSNAMAILLQTLSARLGIVAGRDLAQACRETYPRRVNVAMWALCEIAIAACDLAEVLGAAIGLNLLFHIPLLAGVLLTAADTLLLLWFQSFGIRAIEHGEQVAVVRLHLRCLPGGHRVLHRQTMKGERVGQEHRSMGDQARMHQQNQERRGMKFGPVPAEAIPESSKKINGRREMDQ